VKWRGRPVSEVAKENAVALTRQIASGEGVEAATARLNLRGVAALNDNNPSAAKDFFLQAYKEDAQNSFTLNNLGYIAELSGDRETAEMYYEAARSGRDANARVSYSTRRDAEGQKIDTLAVGNQSDVEATLRAVQEAKRRAQRPIELKRRDAVSGSSDVPGSGEENAMPVPSIGVQAPALPTLPPPSSDQDRNSAPPRQPPDSAPPQ
jgi:hypothetical protein